MPEERVTGFTVATNLARRFVSTSSKEAIVKSGTLRAIIAPTAVSS
jgi:hypothetical protein